ncbi:MAG: hypothetical protein ACJ79S_22405, partial [Gemmatimonadaceae bacterium]
AVRWPLPRGLFWLSFLPGPDARAAPRLAVDGAIMCMPALGPGVTETHCLARDAGASVTVAHPGEGVVGVRGPREQLVHFGVEPLDVRREPFIHVRCGAP